MEEPEVFEKVVDDLEDRGYDAFVHVPGSHSTRYRSVIERCGEHRISIGGRFPDVIGFTNTNRIFAIEVKGTGDMLKGIGQALTYQQGAHISYLAADSKAIRQVSSVALSKGLGMIEVDNTNSEWSNPAVTEANVHVQDVAGQLKYRLQRRGSAGEIAGMALTQPINFLAPTLILQERESVSKAALHDIIVDEYDFHAPEHIYDGAVVLGLISDENKSKLTDRGRLAGTMLNGYGVSELDELEQLKPPRGTVVADEHPQIATLLRSQYTEHPEIRLLFQALSEVSGELPFPELVEILVNQYPNVFLNVFCTANPSPGRSESGREQARALIESGDADQIFKDEQIWKAAVRSNIFQNFVQQLKHIGVLAPETSGHSGKLADFDPSLKPWIPRE
ncbi:hypothetical protein J2751_002302 [Halorubrum alkaliphilum]|uniref:Uncharacterized protein n=1 Tax=Halorubrum alkaliphilum TaxID=261290 RepID=A0A8T4GGI6_9EURY|nr:hypothetical protein [Halorubrum alkaliphilum]MBP1923263.1 hypothetical protein [Halorubrum alkaliphilum]